MTDAPVTLLFVLLVGIPALGGSLLWVLGERPGRVSTRRAAVILSLWPLLGGTIASFLWLRHGNGEPMVERHAWIPAMNVDLAVGLDGLSLVLVILSGLLVPAALSMAGDDGSRLPRTAGLTLLLQAGLQGVFLAMNFLPWFLFWELCLIPAYFLIRLERTRAAARAANLFFLTTFLGSIALLLAFLALYAAGGTMDFLQLARDPGNIGEGTMGLLFALALLGVAVKVPLYPFHFWLPGAYEAAPPWVAMILSGLLSKMGLYALLRLILPVFPAQMERAAPVLLALATASVLVPALLAWRHADRPRRMLAYSSVNHLGYCFLGVFAVAGHQDAPVVAAATLSGVGLQLFNHGVIIAILFFLVWRLERRIGEGRSPERHGGLRHITPRLALFTSLALFASLGLPGLSAFPGEFLIFRGAFAFAPWHAALSTLGLFLTAAFSLSFIARHFSGPPAPDWRGLPDLDRRETLVALGAAILIVGAGLFPRPLLSLLDPAALSLLP